MKYDDHNTMIPAEGISLAVPTPAFAKPRLRRAVLLVIASALIVVAGIKLRDWWTVGRFTESTDDAFVAADITTIAPKVSGFIESVAVVDNQQVHTGDLLATIHAPDYRAELAKAAADVDEQTANLANLDALTQLQAATIDQARAKVAASIAENHRAAADAARSQSLVSQNAISVRDSEVTDAVSVQASADLDGAKAALVAAERELIVIETRKQQSRALLARAKAGVELAQLNLGYTEIRSPIDGIVGNLQMRVGDYATIGARLVSIVPNSGLYIEANFKESQIARMRAGQPVEIAADALHGQKLEAFVDSLGPATGAEFSLLPPENATGNFTKIVQRVPIRIRLSNNASQLGILRPGLSVVVTVNQK